MYFVCCSNLHRPTHYNLVHRTVLYSPCNYHILLFVGIIVHFMLARLRELKIILILHIITSLSVLYFLKEWFLQDDCPLYFRGYHPRYMQQYYGSCMKQDLFSAFNRNNSWQFVYLETSHSGSRDNFTRCIKCVQARAIEKMATNTQHKTYNRHSSSR